MSPVEPKPGELGWMGGEAAWPFAAHFDNDQLWAPYRAASKMLLESQRNMAAIMEIQRKLADEYLQIVRREQDLMHDTFEKILHRCADGEGLPTGVGTLTSESFTELYESAVSSLRELGKAMTDAQTQSLDVLRRQTQAAADAAKASQADRKTAA
ncbi:MAG TPA: hypothetical protein VKB71_17615 [Rhizomicrobium sp.]|nr:hypothetical protein [Rhizomicrobium sp.]